MPDSATMTQVARADRLAARLKPLAGKPVGTLLVHEIYRSLQGEGAHVGLPCTFVRLTACQLRCRYCDSPHAFHEGTIWTPEAVVGRVVELGERLVQITGGEPLLQPEVFPLMADLADRGFCVLLETGGALDIAPVDPRVQVILDLKTPGSGEVAANRWENLDRLKPTDEVKFVVCDRDDFDWAVSQIRGHDLDRRCSLLVGGEHGRVDPTDLASWILASGLPIRLQVQLHKLLWGPTTRGV